jgi:hypothetical protein
MSNEVAAPIFFAAIEEFNPHKPYRTMAKEMVQIVDDYAGLTARQRRDLRTPNPALVAALVGVRKAYLLNKAPQDATERQIYNAIGFHVGAENHRRQGVQPAPSRAGGKASRID